MEEIKVYAFVPAKAASERIENKNTRILSGERLYVKALKTLLSCKEIDKVFLDTESEEMYNLVDYLPIEHMKRNPELANNSTDGHQLFLNEVNSYPDADIYVQLLCTSPFIKPDTIDSAIRILKNNKVYDSAILMQKNKFYFWKDNKPVYDINHIPNSKDLDETLMESMGLYISTRESALMTKRRYGNNPYMIFGELEETVDINNNEDLSFAQTFAIGKKQQENAKLNLIKHLATSCILSDIIDDLNFETGICHGAVINNWQCNISDAKVLGRASTLRLRALEDKEDFHGIYKALNSYKEVAENDIIVVENELKDYAYFGDLNARLAIRAGAAGVIVDGATRDLKQTQNLNFPVWARNYNAADVRKRATVDYINKPIEISGVKITPGDLIFVDECAVVVIYKETENAVLEKILSVVENEKNIAGNILCNVEVDTILKTHGGGGILNLILPFRAINTPISYSA